MKIVFLTVGSIKKNPFTGELADYRKRIDRYLKTELIEVKEVKVTSKSEVENAKLKEGGRILKSLKESDYVVAMDERGDNLTSPAFSQIIERQKDNGRVKRIVFIIGSSYGLSLDVTTRADKVMALSKMIMTHDMALLFLSEQVYRAFTILNNEPYSH